MDNEAIRDESTTNELTRRDILGAVAPAALATTALVGLTAHAQTREGTRKAEHDHSASDPAGFPHSIQGLGPDGSLSMTLVWL